MLKDILAISGYQGLYKLVGQNPKNIIVESLETKKRLPIYHSSKVSALEDIAIYTTNKEVPLVSVFEEIYKIENKQQTTITPKDAAEDIKEYFEDVLPDYDKDRVYISDMKKVIQWYNLLVGEGLLNFTDAAKANESTSNAEVEQNNE